MGNIRKPIEIIFKPIKTPYSHNGISMRPLCPRHVTLFKDNTKLWIRDEKYIRCILEIEDNLHYRKNTDFLYIKDGVIDIIDRNKYKLKFHKWECAYCKKEIEVHEKTFSPKTLTCENCYKTYLHGKEKWTQMIMNSVNKFTTHLKNKYTNEQINLARFIKNKNKIKK